MATDYFEEILEYLDENDKNTLYSCLLVNRFLCKVSVKFLWRNIWNFKLQSEAQRQIIRTLLTCLPNESKKLLHKEETIIIPISETSKPPLFDYVSFFKAFSIDDFIIMIEFFIQKSTKSTKSTKSAKSTKSTKSGSSKNPNHLIRLNKSRNLLIEEILKMFISRTSLKILNYTMNKRKIMKIPYDIMLTEFPGARDCLKNLIELRCINEVRPEVFYQLSQVCHNIETIKIFGSLSHDNGMKKLIILQDNLKCLEVKKLHSSELNGILCSLNNKQLNTITKLHLKGINNLSSISFIIKFTNLQEFTLINYYDYNKVKLEELNYVIFSKLRYFAIRYNIKSEALLKFLENNGENLEEFKHYSFRTSINKSINLAVAKFCLNLKSLYARFEETNTVISILNSCQQLERICVYCVYWEGIDRIEELTEVGVYCDTFRIEALEIIKIIAKYSPKKFHELKLHGINLLPKELETIFMIWEDRIPCKTLTLIIKSDVVKKEENMKVIEKYKKFVDVKYEKYEKYKEMEM
ncbi:hypothetical protein RhiirA1_451554 [Rhizophagus irregularis]|uniref:F-box domain-containing protein n=1 Tax=Rhizophagus irregularis TaxID=588596 RepID=A0A2N0SC14_9GLOM|nr:hypothetical protein RhiirA1_451554 [Rhizophagus irregularis]